MINENARTIELNGETWAIGAVWSAAEYERRPRNLYSFTRDQGFDPEATLVAHMVETSQVGWYQFENESARPRRARFLVQRLLDQVARRGSEEFPLPSVVILNLGECAWMTVLDQAGKVLSETERWGDMADLRAYLQDDEVADMIKDFRKNDRFFPNADEALAWLFEGYRGKPLYAERLYAPSHSIKILAMATTAVIALSIGLYSYHRHVVAEHLATERAQAMAEHTKYLAQLASNAAAKKMADEKFSQRLHDYWANYPRPWVGALAPEAAASACESYVTSRPQNVQGWERVGATCSFSDGTMGVSERWNRGDLATILALPPGALPDGTGNTAVDTITVQVPRVSQSKATPDQLPVATSVYATWIGAGQANPDTFLVKSSGFTQFRPPVPEFVPQSQVKEVAAKTPVLWEQADIDMQTGLAPSDAWPDMDTEGFVVQTISVSYLANKIFWQMTGEQYAK